MISTGEDDTVRDIVFRLIMFETGLNFVIGRCNCIIKGKDLFAPSSWITSDCLNCLTPPENLQNA